MKRSVEYCKRIIMIQIHQFNRKRTNNLQCINFSDRNNDSQIMSIIVLLNCGLHLVSWKGKARISKEMTHHNFLCYTGQLSTEREKGLGSNSKPQLFLPLNLLCSKCFHPNFSPYLYFNTFSSVKLAVKISFFLVLQQVSI
jgi:hypothetical protein